MSIKFLQLKILFLVLFCLAAQFSSAETIKVGVPICLTGGCAEWGQASQNGLILALEKINAKGVLNRKLELIVEDTNEATGGFKAVTAFQKLKSTSGINFFVGPSWTPAGLALAPVVGKMPSVLMISPSLGVAQFNESAPNLFNTMPHSETSTRAVAKLMIERGVKTAAVFSSEQPWDSLQAKVFTTEFTKLGGRVTAEQSVNPDVTDLRAESMKIIATNPQSVFFAIFNQSGIAARQLRTLGFKGDFYSALIDQTRIDIAQGTLEGAISAQFPECNDEFVQLHQKKFGKKPGVSADTAHDAMIALAKAIELASSTEATKVIPKLLKVQFQGASGYVKFDEFGGIIRDPVYIIVKDSKLQKL